MDQIRKYRLDLEKLPFFNSESQGIALFDLIGTFMIAYLFESYFTKFISREIYYISLIPLGVIIHWLIGQKTFLNSKLLNSDFNIYKVLFLVLIYILVRYLS